MGSFDVRTVSEGGVEVVCLSGTLDASSAPRLRRMLMELVSGSHRQVVLDIGGVDFVDSTGLGAMVAALKQARDGAGTVALADPQPNVTRALSITGLSDIFLIYGSAAEARTALGAGQGSVS